MFPPRDLGDLLQANHALCHWVTALPWLIKSPPPAKYSSPYCVVQSTRELPSLSKHTPCVLYLPYCFAVLPSEDPVPAAGSLLPAGRKVSIAGRTKPARENRVRMKARCHPFLLAPQRSRGGWLLPGCWDQGGGSFEEGG